MNKNEFLNELSKKLKALPKDERENIINYYEEFFMDSESEEVAIQSLGTPDKIAKEVLVDYAEKKPNIKLMTILLLIFSSPVTISLGIAGIAILLSLLVVIASLLLSFYSVVVAFIFTTLFFLINLPAAFANSGATGIMYLGGVLASIALTVIVFIFCKFITKLTFKLIKNIAIKLAKRGGKKNEN